MLCDVILLNNIDTRNQPSFWKHTKYPRLLQPKFGQFNTNHNQKNIKLYSIQVSSHWHQTIQHLNYRVLYDHQPLLLELFWYVNTYSNNGWNFNDKANQESQLWGVSWLIHSCHDKDVCIWRKAYAMCISLEATCNILSHPLAPYLQEGCCFIPLRFHQTHLQPLGRQNSFKKAERNCKVPISLGVMHWAAMQKI
jgi:hypothetical protein